MTRLVVLMLLALPGVAWAAAPPDAQTWERFGKIENAKRLNLRGISLYQAGRLSEAKKVLADVVQMRKELYPRARYPRGHSDLATSLNNQALLYEASGDYSKAEPLYLHALQMYEALYPKARYPRGHPNLATNLNNLGFLYQAQGEYAKAEPLYRRALQTYEAMYPWLFYPRGHPNLAKVLNNLGFLHYSLGDYVKAEPLYHRALAMSEALYSTNLYPRGHPELAKCVNNLAALHHARGEYTKAEPLMRRVLKIQESLYPKELYPRGHPNLAQSLNNLAFLHQAQEEYAKAEPLYRRALEMREGLYPRSGYPWGHPDLAQSLTNLAFLYQEQGNFAKAEPLYSRVLEMREAMYPKRLYPQGHPELARTLNNLAYLHYCQGTYAKGEPLYRRSLKIYEAVYPQIRYPHGHPDLAASLNNLASMYHVQGHQAKAEPVYRRALQMYNNSVIALATDAPEAQALNYLASLPLTRDGYLSATRSLPKKDAYDTVWQSKAAIARVFERRHLAILAASSNEARGLWNSVQGLKRERERLLLALSDAAKAKARDARLDEIDELIREKEAKLLPALKRSDDLAKATPADFRKALPPDVAFVDLLRYVRFEQDSRVPGKKGETITPHYLAFIVTGSAVARVELGDARPIEKALYLWRKSINSASPSESIYSAEAHRLLWSPLVKHLPAKPTAVYVSPDAALNRLPWAALRDGKTGRILIEDHAVAVIPHGPMLLDRLTEVKRKPEAKPTLLAMGAVAYDSKPVAVELALRGPAADSIKWFALPGTEKELKQVISLATKRAIVQRDGTLASASTLLADLPNAETAHLATHGFFADARFRTVMQLDEKLFGRSGDERVGAGSRSPMVLSGIVCAGANLASTPNRGVLTAEAIVGLDLRRMNLAVLSACETGLGEVAGGEAVYGLTRAFHVAGTRNVVASLWKVDDEATAALMVLFYRQLWGKEKVTPMEALRRAQLAVYREPDQVKEWAAGRGSLARLTPDGTKNPAKEKTSPARAWAAFVLSGPGD